MFRNRKTFGLFALAAVALTGLAAAPASAGTYRGGRDNVVVYRADSCAPRARVSVGFYGGREYREHRSYRGDDCRDRSHHHRGRWEQRRDRDCR